MGFGGNVLAGGKQNVSATIQRLRLVWPIWYWVAVVALSVCLLALNQLGEGDRIFQILTRLMAPWIYVLFLVAFLPALLGIVLGIRGNAISRVRLIGHSIVGLLALSLNPLAQFYTPHFDQRYVDSLERRAAELRLVGQPEAVAIAALGEPTEIKLNAMPAAQNPSKLLIYRHWWWVWFPTWLQVDVNDGKVTRVVRRS